LVKEDKGAKHVNANGSEGSGGQLKQHRTIALGDNGINRRSSTD
jgi:hypothetical protein